MPTPSMEGKWENFLRQNHLSSAGIISLASGLRSNRSVKTLNLMTQKLGATWKRKGIVATRMFEVESRWWVWSDWPGRFWGYDGYDVSESLLFRMCGWWMTKQIQSNTHIKPVVARSWSERITKALTGFCFALSVEEFVTHPNAI